MSFWPIAATATIGISTVFELRQRATPAHVEAAMRSGAVAPKHDAARVTSSVGSVAAVNEPSAAPAAASSQRALTAPATKQGSSAASSVRAQPSLAPPPSQAQVIPTAVFAPAARATSGVSELTLLESANASLRNDPVSALRLASEHRRLFPNGNLAQERDVISIKALVLLGDLAQAQRSLSVFESSYPGSAHALELRQIVR